MENLKIKVNNEAESKEAQELFFKLGYGWFEKRGHEFNFLDARYLLTKSSGTLHCTKEHIIFALLEIKEITLQELRDKVVLKHILPQVNQIQESKMTALEQKENLKIRVFTEQQTKTVIELAEKLGYKERYPKSFKLTDGYVCLDGDKDILKVRIAQAGSELNEYKEISIFDFCGITKPQHKEYLDPRNNYELIEWDGGFMIQDHWIAVPEGAEILSSFNNGQPLVFHKQDFNYVVGADEDWNKLGLSYDYSKSSAIVWQRDTQPEELPFIDDEPTAWDKQVGGNHYKQFKIQPMQFALENKLDAAQHNVIKYVMRHSSKNGKEDLEKAKHYIDLMIEHYYVDL